MTDKAKRCVAALRTCCLPQNIQPVAFFVCADCSGYEPDVPCQINLTAADLIESLSAELEQVKQERDGLNILLAQSQSMLKTRTRERDAAMQDLDEMHYNICGTCKYCEFEANAKPCASCDFGTGEELGNWQWRGVKEDT